jgi:hypothetical protein
MKTSEWKAGPIRLFALVVSVCFGIQAVAFAPSPSRRSETVKTTPMHSVREQDQRQGSDQAADTGARNPADNALITLPSGTMIPIRLADEVNSKHDKEGALYTGTVDPSVLIQDRVVIPRGTEAHVRLVKVKKGGHVHGKAKVQLELVSLIINGERLGVNTDEAVKTESGVHAKASAEAKKGYTGAGVMAGNPGDAAGPVIAAFSAAKVDVKPGSRIEFTLETPFTFEPVAVRNGQE